MCIGIGLKWKPLGYKESLHKLFSKMVSRAGFSLLDGSESKAGWSEKFGLSQKRFRRNLLNLKGVLR